MYGSVDFISFVSIGFEGGSHHIVQAFNSLRSPVWTQNSWWSLSPPPLKCTVANLNFTFSHENSESFHKKILRHLSEQASSAHLVHQPLEALIYFLALDLLTQDISYEWSHFSCDCFCPACFTWLSGIQFIHVPAGIVFSFYRQITFMNEYRNVTLYLSIPKFGHLGYFQFLAARNNASVNIGVQVFMSVCFQVSWKGN